MADDTSFSSSGTLPVAEFLNDVLARNGVERPGIHIVIGNEKAAKPGIVVAEHVSVSCRIDQLIWSENRSMEFERSVGIDAHVFYGEKRGARRSAPTFDAE